MRPIPIAALLVCAIAPAARGQQAEPAVRRVVAKAFPLSVTLSAGFGFGANRAEETTYDYNGTGSGWQAGVDFQVPITNTLGFELGGQIGNPARTRCERGTCESTNRIWAYRGTATILWRFKARAPIYFGVGGAIAHFSANPVLVIQEPATEYGATGVLGVDFPMGKRVWGRVTWRSYFLQPNSQGLPTSYTATSLAWDNALVFGVRIPFSL
jgi:opacity protein-like surface antigen